MSETMKLDFGKVAVMFGGNSAEREVSLDSGQAVLDALQHQGVDAYKFDPKETPVIELLNQEFDRVFIVLHGRGGEDGSLQGMLNLLDIPYTGSGSQGSAFAMDKVRSKYLFLGAELPSAPFCMVNRHRAYDAETILAKLNGRVMVKPANEGSSIGISQASTVTELQHAIGAAFEYDEDVLVEQWVTGREVTVSILNGEALPVIEMRTPRQFYDYDAKYKSSNTEYICPAPLDETVTKQIQEIAVSAFSLLGCSGWGRVDFIIDESGQPNLLEVNTVPGMTVTSLVPKAANVAGLNFDQLVMAILRGSLG